MIITNSPASTSRNHTDNSSLEIVFGNVDVILHELLNSRQIPPQAYSLIVAHLPVLKDVFGCLKAIETRVFEEDGWLVRHSWTHIKDLK